jgi:AcrR family transcriptional regulator
MSPRSPEQFAEIREERIHQILDAALHVFAEESYHGASMAGIAKRAKISKGLIYNYFKSKEDVLKTLILGLFDHFMEVLDLDFTKPLTKAHFKRIIELSVDEVVKSPARWRLFMSLSFQPDVTPLLMTELMPKLAPFMSAVSNYFAEKGYEDPVVAMRYYSAVLDGIQMHIILDPENFPAEKAKQMLINQFV